ncbi:MAG: SIMPL domain-containing protein [Candidatus Caenarcaniphilales bacterium]|nr:SIMPL domain-containing protein [Candidatus Caenarcaniphilales bacterium]
MKRINSGIYFAIALIAASLIFGLLFYASRSTKDTISVVGYSSKLVNADSLKWNFTLVRTVPLDGLSDGYSDINNDLNFVKSTLIGKVGIDKENILVSPINLEDKYEFNKHSGYNIVQNVSVIAQGEYLDRLSEFALSPAEFLDQNIIFRSSYLSFTLSDLSKLKRKLLADATIDAQKRALAIAKSAKNQIGKLKSLRVGVFQITEPLSTEVSNSGIYNTSSKEKTISVTVNANFYLK